MEEEDVIGNTQRVGKVMKDLHHEMKAKHKCVGDVRSIGLFGCLELVKNRKTKEPIPVDIMAKANNYLKANRTFAKKRQFLTSS